jgi:MFS family permease
MSRTSSSLSLNTYGQRLSHVMAEAAGGAVGGYAGGVLADRIDVATHPGHRAEAHSMAITGTVGWIVSETLPEWQAALRSHADRFAAMRMQTESPILQVLLWIAEYFCRFLAGLAAGVLGGYASHLMLDFFTPASLPVV